MKDDGKCNILVVDDDRTVIIAIASALKPRYLVMLARNGQQAIEVAEKNQPDLIMMDNIMPEMTGLEALMLLKQSERTKKIPVIILTGQESVSDEKAAFALGAVDFIRKPFNSSVLEARINHHLRVSREIRDKEISRESSTNSAKAKMDFILSIVNEIKPPLNAIIKMTETLHQESLTSQQNKYVSSIKNTSCLMMDIINDVLDFSLLMTSKPKLSPVHYDFHQFIANITSVAMFSAREKELNFEVKKSDGFPVYVYGDDVCLRQILLNLLSTAFRYTERGYVRLSLDHTPDKLFVTVEDSGPGVYNDEKKHMSESDAPQASSLKKRDKKTISLGLGLPVVKSWVALMGGELTVKSTIGAGTKFNLTFPYTPGDERHVQQDIDAINTLNAPDAKILLVDDVKTNLGVGSELFRLFGINCDTALNGMEAIALITKKEYDIVYMDQMMPEMDGLEATKAIRRLGGTYASLPIVALTGNSLESERAKLFAAGMNDFISKPINVQMLGASLLKWLPEWKRLVSKPDDAPEETQEQNASVIQMAMEVDGLDVNAGLERFNGSHAIYEKALRDLCKEIGEDLEVLEDDLENDLPSFMIRVHGMGSTLALMGQMRLSKESRELERASKENDITFCKTHFPGFLKELSSFHASLVNIFKEGDAQNSVEKTEGDHAELVKTLKQIADDLDMFDMHSARSGIDLLIPYTYGSELDDLLQQALEAIEEYDYDLAAELVADVRAKVGSGD